jgi:hypothetical protein
MGGLSGAALASTVACNGTGPCASGASLQQDAWVSVWLPGWASHTNCTPGTQPSITWVGSTSGRGLDEFGYDIPQIDLTQDQTANTAAVGGPFLDWFTGTDVPPNAGQLANAEAAGGGANPIGVVVPVAQAPITIMLSLPIGCTLAERSHFNLDAKVASQLFEPGVAPGTLGSTDPGEVQTAANYVLPTPGVGTYSPGTWGALFYDEGYVAVTGPPAQGQFSDSGVAGNSSACNQPIQVFVRDLPAGESYDLKAFFGQLNPHVWNAFANDDTSWPAPAGTDAQVVQSIVVDGINRDNAFAALIASNVAVTPGSVGYADADNAIALTRGQEDGAHFPGFSNSATTTTCHDLLGNDNCPAHQIVYAEVQNNVGNQAPVYADAVSNAGGAAPAGNCETAGNVPLERGAPKFEFDSWFGVLASDPDVGEHITGLAQQPYPICATTYVLAWKHYSNTPLFGNTTNAHNVANAVKDLLSYVTGATTGQNAINSYYDNGLPPNLQAKARIAVAQIGF